MIDEARRRNLGRGLSALLGEEEAPAPEAATHRLRVDVLHPGRYQPRHKFDPAAIEALSQSIREKGVLQPLLVRHHPSLAGEYEIIAGERRWRAAQLAQLHEVPVVLRAIDDREALEIALVENLQRQDLSPLEEAEAYRRLLDEFSHTQDAVAQAVGKSRSHVANTLRLLDLPLPVKRLLDDGMLTAGHARALLTAPDPTALAGEVVRRGLNVRQAERLAKRGPAKPRPRRVSAEAGDGKDADTRALERDLSAVLGLVVSVDPAGSGGTITIRYQSLEQLDDVLRRLSQPPPPRS
ncbi:MAG TPA: ParB/RepB/Spo0J family partition protein [Stellaceae bacterium]|nr:ParB/RepB/Spo0J family partition protein [Stellaceae bacterium]